MKPTCEFLADTFGMDVTKVVEYVKGLIAEDFGTYPQSPPKPKVKVGMSATELREVANAIDEYDAKFSEYKEKLRVYNAGAVEYEGILKQYIENIAGVNSVMVPEEYRKGVKAFAWSHGHSSGYCEYANYLFDIVETIFAKDKQ